MSHLTLFSLLIQRGKILFLQSRELLCDYSPCTEDASVRIANLDISNFPLTMVVIIRPSHEDSNMRFNAGEGEKPFFIARFPSCFLSKMRKRYLLLILRLADTSKAFQAKEDHLVFLPPAQGQRCDPQTGRSPVQFQLSSEFSKRVFHMKSHVPELHC